MKLNHLGIAAPKQNLLRLVIIRWLLLLFILVGLAVSIFQFQLALPYEALIAAALCIAIVNVATSVRLKQSWPVTTEEFSFQILGDIIGVTVLFYFCGGASNPFVSYYLVPLSIGSATLSWKYTGWLMLLSVGCYTLLLFQYIPVSALEPVVEIAGTGISGHVHEGGQKINPHILGMWFNFIMSAGLITFFVVRMSQALKQQQQQLNDYREDILRDEQVLAVATLAAGTAHELGSPLTTMKLLLGEMSHDVGAKSTNKLHSNDELKNDLKVLSDQVDLCSSTLKDLVKRAEHGNSHNEEETIYNYCQHIVNRWKLLRPEAIARITIQENHRDRLIHFHSTIEQAVINLLNNAADACRLQVIVEMKWSIDFLIIINR